MIKIAEVQDVVTVKMFCYTNKFGGTGIAEEKNEKELFKNPIKCKITKAWDDYECGWRYHAEPLKDQTDLLKYLKENAKGTKMYVSEFDITNIE